MVSLTLGDCVCANDGRAPNFDGSCERALPTTIRPPVPTTLIPCPSGLIRDNRGNCVCTRGLILQNGRCVPPATPAPTTQAPPRCYPGSTGKTLVLI